MTEVASAQTIIIPALSVSETYDSNVFYTPKSQLGPGQTANDFITTVSPQLNVAHGDQYMRGSLQAGALISNYVNNPSLDYVGYNAAGQLDLRGWATSKVSQRITTLTVIGTFQYTPTRSGFGTVPAGSGVGTNFGSTQLGPLNSGLITNRVSTHVYSLGVTGGYQLTPATTLSTTYAYTRLSFGSQSGGQNNALFDTTGHAGTATLTTLVTPTDSVGMSAMGSIYSQDQSTGGGTSSFTTVSGTGNWSRRWTQEWNSSLAAGAYVIPGSSTQSATTIAPSGTAMITYRSFSEALRATGTTLGGLPSDQGPFANLPSLIGSLNQGGIMSPGAYTASLLYTFSVFPSYAGGAGALKAHVVGLTPPGGSTAKLTRPNGVNYAHSHGT